MSELVREATDPGLSVVVQACAGSGKTWMLVTRIFRLLLSGASPESILAITFTRKAAEEMRQRLDELLEQCVLLPDAGLTQLLEQRCCAMPAGGLASVRALALEVIAARRGVEINTFHGWFTSLCQLAPTQIGFSRRAEPSELGDYWLSVAWDGWMARLEADANPVRDGAGSARGRSGYETRDEAEVEDEVHNGALGQPDASGSMAAFTRLVNRAGASRARSVIMSLAAQRAAWRLMVSSGNTQALLDQLALDFKADEARGAADRFFADVCLQQHMECVYRLQMKDSPAKQKVVAPLPDAWAARDVDTVERVLRTSEGGARQFKFTKTVQATLGQADLQAFDEAVAALQSALDAVLDARFDAFWFEVTRDALELLPDFLASHEQVKAQAGVIDFEDLEMTAGDIMADEQASAWVQMRLDRRTQHLLLDEFQDTNPLQWIILRHWLTSHMAGDGHSVFMVGDPKQSIYRFRRAEARLFVHVRDWMQTHLNAVVLQTHQSRRCDQAVLDAVNAAFLGPLSQRTGSTLFEPHVGLGYDPAAGLYVLPLVAHGSRQPPGVRSSWLDEPGGAVGTGGLASGGAGDAVVQEAWRAAQTLAGWKFSGDIARWDAVMVLVRRHEDAKPLGHALQRLAIPHTINDRGSRFQSLLWSDTLALLRVLLSGLNERSELQLLRSPFFSLSADAVDAFVIALSHLQQPAGLRAASAAQAQGGEVARAYGRMAQWRQWAAELPLHDVLERIFTETDIQAAAVSQAPQQERSLALNHWGWLIEWALDLDKGRMPHPLRALQEAVRLEAYSTAASGAAADTDGVRIYTVHGAKGLEADIVWLLNANRGDVGERGGEVKTLLSWPLGQDKPDHLSVHAGRDGRGSARASWFAAEDAAQADESDHLLYVAMTRARRRIVVSGAVNRKGEVQAGSWYARLSVLEQARAVDWPTMVEEHPAAETAHRPVAQGDGPNAAIDVSWDALPDLPMPAAPIGQSMPSDESASTRRGEAWHACLEHITPLFFNEFSVWWEQVCQLPDCAAALSRIDEQALQAVRSSLSALSVQTDVRQWIDPDAADVSFNEFEWMDADGHLHRADRIVRHGQDWTVVDYKWGWTSDDLPGYRTQLQRYALALRQTMAPEARIGGLLLSSSGVCLPLSLTD